MQIDISACGNVPCWECFHEYIFVQKFFCQKSKYRMFTYRTRSPTATYTAVLLCAATVLQSAFEYSLGLTGENGNCKKINRPSYAAKKFIFWPIMQNWNNLNIFNFPKF